MRNPCLKRWLWFLALWAGGVVALLLVAMLIRWALPGM